MRFTSFRIAFLRVASGGRGGEALSAAVQASAGDARCAGEAGSRGRVQGHAAACGGLAARRRPRERRAPRLRSLEATAARAEAQTARQAARRRRGEEPAGVGNL